MRDPDCPKPSPVMGAHPSRRSTTSHVILAAVWLVVVLNNCHCLVTTASAFVVQPTARHSFARLERLSAKKNKSKPSKVQDPDGPTPVPQAQELEMMDPEDIPELQEPMTTHDIPAPIPYQSTWRKGETDGCHDPISSEWRLQAADIITKAVDLVGGHVLDVTWYLTQVVVTVDDTQLPPMDLLKDRGPQIEVQKPVPPMYYDPTDPDPEEIWNEEEGALFQHRTEHDKEQEEIQRQKMYVAKDEDDPEDEPHVADFAPGDDIPILMDEEYREDVALRVTEEEQERQANMEKPMDIEHLQVNTQGLSIVAQAILDALEDYEDELRVLQRHELILASPGPADVLETQKQFDAYRNSPVIVETQDPFESNRVLKGKLIDRNSMDLIINKQGRMVTIPLNFVKCVRVPQSHLEETNIEGMAP